MNTRYILLSFLIYGPLAAQVPAPEKHSFRGWLETVGLVQHNDAPAVKIENRSGRTLYYAWYEAQWNASTNNFGRLIHKQSDGTLLPGASTLVSAPLLKKYHARPEFVCSFEQKSLQQELTSDKDGHITDGVVRSTQEQLTTKHNHVQVFEFSRCPLLTPYNFEILLTNATNDTLFGAFYYVDKQGRAERLDELTTLIPQHRRSIHYPVPHPECTIEFWAAHEPSALSKTLLEPQPTIIRKQFEKTNIFNWYAGGNYTLWYNVERKEQPLGISSLGGGMLGLLARVSFDITYTDEEMSHHEAALAHNHLYHPSEHARNARKALGKEGAPQQEKDNVLEHSFLARRQEHCRQALNSFLGREALAKGEKVPHVALVFSGGGYRAMIQATGFMRGAHICGLFDACSTMNGLSGSSWAVFALAASSLSPTEFATAQRTKLNKGAIPGLVQGSLFKLGSLVLNVPDYKRRRFIQERHAQYHGLIGLYGHAIAQCILEGYSIDGKGPHDLTLTDLRAVLADGSRYPLPIGVALDFGNVEKRNDRIWYEFSPYYVGSHQVGRWLDTHLFSSVYNDGIPCHIGPEYPLAHYMGIMGSAFAVSAHDIAQVSPLLGMFAQGIAGIGRGLVNAYHRLLNITKKSENHTGRFQEGLMPNYTYNLAHDDLAARYTESPLLRLVDGGMLKDFGTYRHNFASIPALARHADLIILCDSPSTPNKDTKPEHLMATSEEANRLQLPFPNCAGSLAYEKQLLGYKDKLATWLSSQRGPEVVYLQGKKIDPEGFDPDKNVSPFTNTTNFDYTPEQYDNLCNLTTSIMSHPDTVATIKKALERTLEKARR